MFKEFISPILYLPKEDLHVPHFYHKMGNFSQSALEELKQEFGDDNDSIQKEAELFSNPLRFAQYDPSKKKRGVASGYTPPGQRITNGGWMVFTFEHDGPDAASLETQLDWFAGKRDICDFHKVHTALSRYQDYRGYSTVFSGNKSLHIHLVFDTRHLSNELAKKSAWANATWQGDVPDQVLHELYRSTWVHLATTVQQSLGVPIKFDERLSSYIQKRRSPWGTRMFQDGEKPNVHGFQPGDFIEQTVIQEHMLSRAPTGSTNTLMLAKSAKAIMEVERHSQSRPSKRAVSLKGGDAFINELKRYLHECGWAQYPEPTRIEYLEPYNYLFFKNHANDGNPTTFVRGDYRMVAPSGIGAHSGPLFLPNGYTLDETLNIVEQRLAVQQVSPIASEKSKSNRPRKYSASFGEKALSRDTARANLSGILRNVADAPGTTLVQAPEGIGKTYALMQHVQERRWDREADSQHRTTQRDGDTWSPIPGFICFACKSYEQANAKRNEFIGIENGNTCAVVIKSLSKLYQEAADEFGVKPIERRQAGANGSVSFLHAVKSMQPAVYTRMTELRDEMWMINGHSMFDPTHTVVFCVHSLLKNWPHSQISKAFLHPGFPDDFNQDGVKHCIREMGLYQVIYDEVGWEDLVGIDTKEDVKLAKKVAKVAKKSTGCSWKDAGLPAQVQAFDAVVGGYMSPPMGFDECNRINQIGYQKSDKLKVDAKRFPFGKGVDEINIYAQRIGTYYSKEHRWWSNLGCPVVILTTEDLPRCIASSITLAHRAEDQLKLAAGQKPHREESQYLRTMNLTNTPHLFNELVPIYFDEDARAPDKKGRTSVIDMAQDLLESGIDFVISNNLKNIDKKYEDQVCSHQAARGRNDLTGMTIATIITYPSLGEYDQLCILGQKFDLDDPVAMAMRDTLFQDLGRNLGLRSTPEQKQDMHMVFIKSSLYRDLKLFTGATHDRYRLYHDDLPDGNH